MKHFSIQLIVLFVFIGLSSGCARYAPKQSKNTYENIYSEVGSGGGFNPQVAQGPAAKAPQANRDLEKHLVQIQQQAPPQQPNGQAKKQPQQLPAGQAKKQPEADTERKIQYTADIQTVVKEFDKAQTELLDLIKATKGAFRSDSSIEGQAGQRQTGTYTVRVPVGEFETFCEGVSKIGSVVTNSISSNDRTVEYYDLKGRISAKEKLLQELEKFYETSKDTKDTLKVYQEIKNERTELEGMKGQFMALQNVTSMSTVTIRLIADEHYVPPQPRTFGENISQTFWGSIDALLWVGRGIVLVAVGAAPWVPVVAVVVFIAWLVNRKMAKPTTVTPTTVMPTTGEPSGEG